MHDLSFEPVDGSYDYRPIAPDEIIRHILDRGIARPDAVAAALGSERHQLNLAKLEQRLVTGGIVTDSQLLTLKGEMAGAPIFDDETIPVKRTDCLPEQVAKGCGALQLDATRLTVAFVDPDSESRRVVAQALRSSDYDVVLMTTNQFISFFRRVYQRQDNHDSRPAAPDIFAILEECVTRRGSDIHLTVTQPPMLRVDGGLNPLPYAPVQRDWIDSQVRMLARHRYDELVRTKSLDFAQPYGDHRFRFNVGKDRHGWNIVARLLATRIPTMEDIALPQAVQNFTHLERGIVLVTGPTGSGKSTTLAAILDHIARNQSRHLITLEDPIEYVLSCGPDAVVNQRELEEDFTTFPAALKQALRQDPDVILVGELRDMETARTAVTAAETGHLVFSTLHTYDAAGTVERLISMFPEAEQGNARQKLGFLLKGVVSQTLVPRANRAGRVAAMEIMIGTNAIANSLKSEKGISTLRQTIETSRKDGMQTMDMALASLVRRALITIEEAEFRSRDLQSLHRFINQGGI